MGIDRRSVHAANKPVSSVVPFGVGKAYLAGSFTTARRVERYGIVRLDDGNLDNGFV